MSGEKTFSAPTEGASPSPAADSTTPTRAYNSALRTRQAAETRRRILEAAADRFAALGYAGASLSDIAKVAGVSVETVKLSGPKRDLLLAAFEQTFAGREGSDSLADHEPIQEITQTPDTDAYIAGLVSFVAEANRRSYRLWAALLGAAASDEVLAKALAALQQRRRADFLILVDTLAERGVAPENISEQGREQLTDALSFLLSPEGYGQLVAEAGWDQERYEAWLVRGIRLQCGDA